LPATDEPIKDLEIFEKLMAMDDQALVKRAKAKRVKTDGFTSYMNWVDKAARPEECGDELYAGIWDEVNEHLGTEAQCFPDLVEQLGVMRFGRRPKVADVFCGSGQIPFEAARLGCDSYASDLNPIACMLTWGAFNIVGATPEKRREIEKAQAELASKVQAEIDALDIEQDGKGWRAKVFLYCVEIRCPQSGWLVPLLPSLVVSKGYKVIAQLEPDTQNKRYTINIIGGVTESQLAEAESGTLREGEVVHSPDGIKIYRTKISTLRGDYTENGQTKNRLRLWEKHDFIPRQDDLYQERLYCIQWMQPKKDSSRDEYQFRAVTQSDLAREQKVIDVVGIHLSEWQDKGWIPDMVIEPGYNTDQPIRERGWTHWHHLFNPRQLLIAHFLRQNITGTQSHPFASLLNYNVKLCRWDSNPGPGRAGKAQSVFDNQALNTLYNYAVRGSAWNMEFFQSFNK
jgi:putative DNA methylase